MSYVILCDGNILYANNLTQYALSDCTLETELNVCDKLNFTMQYNHPMWSSIQKMKSVIEVKKDGLTIFKGRMLNEKIGWNNDKHCECEGCLAYLNDSIIDAYDFESTSRESLLNYIVNQHNLQVDDAKKLNVGTVSFAENVTRSNTNIESAWSNIKSKLLDDGYLIPRYESNGIYLDYLKDISETNTQRITLGTNLLDLSKEMRGEDVASVLMPLGAAVDGVRVDVSSVNDGSKLIENSDLITQYGRITKVVTFDVIDQPAILKAKAIEYLAQQGETITLDVNAFDMSNVSNASAINVGKLVYVVDDLHNVSATVIVSKRSYDLMNPANDTFTLSKKSNSITDFVNGEIKAIDNIVIKVVGDIDTIKQEVSQYDGRITSIEQTSEEVRTTVAEVSSITGVIGITQVVDKFGVNVYGVTDYDEESGAIVVDKDNYTRQSGKAFQVITNGEVSAEITGLEFISGKWIMKQSDNHCTLDFFHRR